MKNANHIFSRQGFTAGHGCFNFPRAHQGNIRQSSHRAAFTEQIRPHPLAVFLPRQTFKHPSNPPCPTQTCPMRNPIPGQECGVRAVTVWLLTSCPSVQHICIQTLLTLNRPATSACRDWLHSLDQSQIHESGSQPRCPAKLCCLQRQERHHERRLWSCQCPEYYSLWSQSIMPRSPAKPRLLCQWKMKAAETRYISYGQRGSQCIAKRLFGFLSTQVTSLQPA